MGRKSRLKRERRADPRWQGFKAEMRGQRMAPTVAAYEAALDARGIEGPKEGLYSRHNQRWFNLASHGEALAELVLPDCLPAA